MAASRMISAKTVHGMPMPISYADGHPSGRCPTRAGRRSSWLGYPLRGDPTVPAFTREFFEPVMLDLFYQLVTERQLIWVRRQDGSPPPWTNDPILRTEFITNMYRELDPGTQYLREKI